MAGKQEYPEFVLPSEQPRAAAPPDDSPDFTLPSEAPNVPDFSVYANQGAGASPISTTAVNPNAALRNTGDESYLSGAVKGGATGIAQGLQDVPAAYNAAGDFGDWVGAHIESYLRGVPLEQAQKDREARGQAVKNFVAPVLDPINAAVAPLASGAASIEKNVAENAQYKPTSEAGKIAQSGVRGATSSLFMGGPETVGMGLVGGAAQQSATDATNNPYIGTAAGILAPILTHTVAPSVAGVAKSYVGPMTEAGRTAKAAEMVGNAATNPQAALTAAQTAPKEIIPGSTPNLAEQTGDIGLAQATKAAGIANPEFAARQMANAGDQNAARARAIDQMAPGAGDVMSPTATLNKQLSDIDAAHESTINNLAQRADTLNSGVMGNFDPELVGSTLRNVTQEASDAASKARSRLYDLVDPDNKLAVVTAQAADAAKQLRDSIDPAVSVPSPNATPVINMVANLAAVTPFNKLTALDSTITAAMAQAKRSGDYIGHNQLKDLKSAVMGSINDAVDNQNAWEQAAIARGELNPADSIRARFENDKEVAGFGNPGRDSTANDSAVAVGASGMGAPPSVGSGLEPSQGAGGLRASAGDQGIQSRLGPGGDNNPGAATAAPGVQGSGTPNASPTTGSVGRGPGAASAGVLGAEKPQLAPNFDEDAAARLATAKQAHAQYDQTYRQGPVKSMLSTNGFAGQYRNAASTIPAKAFPAGNTGYSTTSAFLKAANNSPEAVSAIQDMAMARLRAGMKGDALDPKALAAWKQNYGQALKAVDEASPGFSSKFDNAATATQALNDARIAKVQDLKLAQEGAAGKLMGATTPGEVRQRVSDMIRAKDGPTQIKSLLSRMQNDPGAVQGLQRAAAESLLESVRNAGMTDGERIISGDKLGKLLANHGDAVEALFGQDGLANMKAIAADVKRSQIAMDNTRARSGADTGANVFKKMQEIAAKSGHLSIGGAMTIAGVEALHSGDVMGATGIAALAGLRAGLGRLRANGINKVNDLYLQALENPEVGKAMLQTYIDKQGQARPSALIRLGQTIEQSAKMLATPQQPTNEPREARAHGGAVKKSHEFLVNRLIKLVDMAKRDANRATEPLLNAPDPVVVKALQIAKQGI
ncbi:hypothetical protein GCM10007874_17500 [Labrys miyagiensis]|uniref:Uncharacterized protein n=1 Tax=Labrys miyagiensis TaxID=346912 RepID=A0ABQ6CEP2_9HYPH|nr:hypothetical protein [Labrys miyagiensis]GLS18733.1 hypothetical protein GCM10007874_17500 [Labrys miyagiensis]